MMMGMIQPGRGLVMDRKLGDSVGDSTREKVRIAVRITFFNDCWAFLFFLLEVEMSTIPV